MERIDRERKRAEEEETEKAEADHRFFHSYKPDGTNG
jgi:hypothetical protein